MHEVVGYATIRVMRYPVIFKDGTLEIVGFKGTDKETAALINRINSLRKVG